MKKLAIILNIILFLFAVAEGFSEGDLIDALGDFNLFTLGALGVILGPPVTLYVFWKEKNPNTNEGVISLYMKRKKLEEKKKLEKLTNSK